MDHFYYSMNLDGERMLCLAPLTERRISMSGQVRSEMIIPRNHVVQWPRFGIGSLDPDAYMLLTEEQREACKRIALECGPDEADRDACAMAKTNGVTTTNYPVKRKRDAEPKAWPGFDLR